MAKSNSTPTATCADCLDLLRENKKLSRENGKLGRENGKLGRKNEKLTAKTQKLEEKVAELAKALAAAKRAGKRQAAPFGTGKKKKKPKKRGRKAGHPGSRRKKPKNIDKTLEAPPLKDCPECNTLLVDIKVLENYQTDFPLIVAEVIRFLFASGWCPCCAKRVFSRHEDQISTATGAAAHHLGPRILAFAADLKARLGVPYGKIVEILREQFKIEVTAGALAQANQRLADLAKPTMEKLKESLSKEAVAYADESGWRVDAESWWLWVVCSERITIYEIVPHRKAVVVRDILGEDFQGWLMRDGWSSYDAQLQCLMLRCLFHLRHNAEDKEDAQIGAAAEDVSLFILWIEGVFDLRHRADELTAEQYAKEAGELVDWLDEFSQADHASAVNAKFAARLREIRHQIVPYVLDPTLPATNNCGERQVRPLVANRKISAGNKTERGAKTLASLGSLATSCRQQGKRFIDLVHAILTGHDDEAMFFLCEPTPSGSPATG
jgi:transposase